MAYFAVIRQEGEDWDRSRGMREQDGWDAHADFMDALADEGFVVLGGPIGTGDPHRAMMIVDAADEAEVERRLAEDPWPQSVLRTASIEPWEVLLGALGRA
jgi:uncharacterized protein